MMKLKSFLIALFASFNLIQAQTPFAYYSFDDSTTNDKSGNLNHGVNNGAVPTTDRFGSVKAMNFNGNSNYIEIPDGILSSSTISISVWFKTTGGGVIIGQQNTGATGNPSLYVPTIHVKSNGQLGVGFWTGTIGANVNASPQVYNDNQWHHVVLVAVNSGGTQIQSCYIDGVFKGSLNTYTLLPNMVKAFIGLSATSNGWTGTSGNYFFKGDIDDVNIYAQALQAKTIDSLYLVGKTSIARLSYSFDASNANDDSGNGNHGSVTNCNLTTDRFGNANKAYAFDENLTSTINMPMEMLQDKYTSISMWFKTSSSGALIGHADASYVLNANQHAPVIYIGTNGFLYAGFWSGVVVNANPNGIIFNDNQWHHVVLVASPNVQFCYIDNVFRGQSAGKKDMPLMDYSFIGTSAISSSWPMTGSAGAFYFNGSIDDVNIYNGLLTVDQVDSLFHATNPLTTNEQVVLNKLDFYPNPTSGMIHFDYPLNVSIINSVGQCLIQEKQVTNVDISHLVPGIYSIICTDKNGQKLYSKVVKN